MPRLPTLDDLGSRPVPVSRRGVASVRNAGAVADAAAGLGSQVAAIGQDMLEQQDRLDSATARGKVLAEDVAARTELQNDPNYETAEDRYTSRMGRARSAAAQLIKSNRVRRAFEAETATDIARGVGEVRALVQGKHISNRRAALDDTLFSMQDVGQYAPDDASRVAALDTANAAITSARDGGFINPLEASNLAQSFTSGYIVRQFDIRMDREDPDGAKQWLDANRGRLDWQTESALDARVRTGLQSREAVALARQYVGAGNVVADPKAPDGAPPLDRLVHITMHTGEGTGGNDRYANGTVITSPKGAQGRMQVMPGTNTDPGFGIRPAKDNSDAERARVGRDYLAAMLDRYKNDPAQAWAAYNAGPGSLDAAKAKASKAGNPAGWLSYMPAETRDYVSRNMAALGRDPAAQQSPLRHDLNSIYSRVDDDADREGWTPEKRERVKDQVAQFVDRDEKLLRRQQDDAYDAALTRVEGLGPRFTDITQIGALASRLSPEQRTRLIGQAEQNRKPKEIPAHGDAALGLTLLSIREPDQFQQLDLRGYRYLVTPGEFEQLLKDQANLREKGPAGAEAVTRGRIASTIEFYGRDVGLKTGPNSNKDERSRYLRVMDDMRKSLAVITQGKGVATDEQIRAAFDRATMKVWQDGEEILRSDIDPAGGRVKISMPVDVRNRIIASYQRTYGRPPSEDEIGRDYLRLKGVDGFWR